MKIAALIRAYHRPDQLDLLLDRLGGALWAPYVHIDRKADAAQFAGSRDKAVFIDDRVQVTGAGSARSTRPSGCSRRRWPTRRSRISTT